MRKTAGGFDDEKIATGNQPLALFIQAAYVRMAIIGFTWKQAPHHISHVSKACAECQGKVPGITRCAYEPEEVACFCRLVVTQVFLQAVAKPYRA